MRLMLASVRSFSRHPECSLPLQAAASSEGVVPAFKAAQAPPNSALAVSRSVDEPMGRPPVRSVSDDRKPPRS